MPDFSATAVLLLNYGAGLTIPIHRDVHGDPPVRAL